MPVDEWSGPEESGGFPAPRDSENLRDRVLEIASHTGWQFLRRFCPRKRRPYGMAIAGETSPHKGV